MCFIESIPSKAEQKPIPDNYEETEGITLAITAPQDLYDIGS